MRITQGLGSFAKFPCQFAADGAKFRCRLIWSNLTYAFDIRKSFGFATGIFAAEIADWRSLDSRDADLGGTNPVPLDVPAPSGKQALVLALGKDGRAYLLDRRRLGGIGGSLASEIVATRPIRMAPAAYPAGEGVYVAFEGSGAHCPDSRRGDALTVLQIRAGSPPTLVTGWCGALQGEGSPIVTTTDGHSNPIVWIVGAEGDNRLHGYRGDTGEPLFGGGGPQDAMTGLRHFQGLLAAGDRLYVGADGRLYAFVF